MLSPRLAADVERPPVAIVADTATTTERNIDRWTRLMSDVTTMVVTAAVVTTVVVMTVATMTVACKGFHVIPHVMNRRLHAVHGRPNVTEVAVHMANANTC